MIQLIEENGVSFLVGIASSLLAALVIFTVNVLRDRQANAKYRGFVGEYFLYHFASAKGHRLIEGSLTVSYRLGKLRVKAISEIYSYSGSVHPTEANIYIRVDGVMHSELSQYVFPNPASFSIDSPLVGVNASVNPINDPYAFLEVVSPFELDEAEVKRLMESDVVVRTPYHFMTKPNLEMASTASASFASSAKSEPGSPQE